MAVIKEISLPIIPVSTDYLIKWLSSTELKKEGKKKRMCISLCLQEHMCYWTGKCYKNMCFSSLPYKVSELKWTALRLLHHYVNCLFTNPHTIRQVRRSSYTGMSSPLNNYLMCNTYAGYKILQGFGFWHTENVLLTSNHT